MPCQLRFYSHVVFENQIIIVLVVYTLFHLPPVNHAYLSLFLEPHNFSSNLQSRVYFQRKAYGFLEEKNCDFSRTLCFARKEITYTFKGIDSGAVAAAAKDLF